MQYLAEAIQRKMIALLSQFGHVLSRPTPMVAEPSPFTPHLIPRFYPYHFLTPEMLHSQLHFSPEGVPVRFTGDRRDYINPVYPAYYGLVCLNAHLQKGDEAFLEKAMHMAHFLRAHGRRNDGAMLLEINASVPRFHVAGPFASCLAQGLAASLFLRLHKVHSGSWRDDADQCVRRMLLPIDDGGTLRTTPEGLHWLEEYPGDPPSFVLNGFLFALIALLEAEASGLSYPLRSQDLVATLVKTYHHYRYSRYLRYDRLHRNFCNPQYMGLHVLLFYHLYCSTGLPQMLTLACDIHQNTHWPLYFRSFETQLTPGHTSWLEAEVSC
ncbi:MAG: D-glucuronyl C5-epimerase family protein [Saprospiraceae bacterium]|nr:D-glucuronyl C5-epimerase family protein [Saprospiraceae bacterium]